MNSNSWNLKLKLSTRTSAIIILLNAFTIGASTPLSSNSISSYFDSIIFISILFKFNSLFYPFKASVPQ
jgi:hypothetical protein